MASFPIRDMRGASQPRAMQDELSRLRQQGLTLPTAPSRAIKAAQDISNSVSDGSARAALTNPQIAATRARGMGRVASTGGEMTIALDKQREPLQSMQQKGIPFDTRDPEELFKIRSWCRAYAATHHLIPLMIDIYSRFPIQGIEVKCKDQSIKKFYEQLFFNDLDYEKFLLDFGNEYFTVGETNSLANFNETLGVWDNEELINPEDLIVQKSPFLKNPRYKLMVPEMIREIIETQEPRQDYEIIVQQYPEFLSLMNSVEPEKEGLDISNILLLRTINKGSPWDVRGTPHMLRCFQTLIGEESLNAAQDAIADRLYSPLIMAKLGSPDLGDGAPWIPDPEELANFKNDMQMALAADFRFIAYHFGIEVENVFGREQMPRLGDDYDRIERKLLQVWGIGESMISGGSGQAAYASSALNRELMSQLLSGHQKAIQAHFKERVAVVAEAQEHFDYKVSNGVRSPEYEEILEVDPESGEEYIRKRPKLIEVELSFQTMNLRDEQVERTFMQTLKESGVPVSDQAMMINVPIEFKDELERIKEEKVQKIVADAQAQESAVKAIRGSSLPLSPELQLVWQQMQTAAKGYPEPAPPAAPGAPQLPGNSQPNRDQAGQAPAAPGQNEQAPKAPLPGSGSSSNGSKPPIPASGGSNGKKPPIPASGGGAAGGAAGGSGAGMGSGMGKLPMPTDPNSPQAQMIAEQQAAEMTALQDAPSPMINDITTDNIDTDNTSPGVQRDPGKMKPNKLPQNQISQRPSISDEQRAGAPKSSGKLSSGPSVVGLRNKLSTEDVADAVTQRRWTRSLSDDPEERLAAAQEKLGE